MHLDVVWETAKIQSMQIHQVHFLMDMLKSWLVYIYPWLLFADIVCIGANMPDCKTVDDH